MSNIQNKRDDLHRLIRLDEVLELLPISKSTWWMGSAQENILHLSN